MNSLPDFQHQQRQFLQYLRQPQSTPLPNGFSAERISVYTKLLYNKFDESLSACFPVIRSLLPETEWRTLLLDFIAEHRCSTPYYRRIPEEFVQYLQQERCNADDKPFLVELAHFEWIELELSIAEADSIKAKTLTCQQLLTKIPVFTPVMELLQYRWPVQSINSDYQPLEPLDQPSHILGFRDADDVVQFVALNPMTAQLVLLLSAGLNGQQALDRLGADLDHSAFHSFKQLGLNAITELHRRGAIIDVRPAPTQGDL